MRNHLRLVCASLLAAAAGAAEPADSPLRDIVAQVRELESQIQLIERESAHAIDRQSLWTGATRGLVEAADQHGRYIARDEVAVYGLDTEPLRHGLGCSWRHRDGLEITRVVRGSPAARAGLGPGAVVTAINGAEVAGLGRIRAAEAMARSGEEVALAWTDLDGSAHQASIRREAIADDGLDQDADLGRGLRLLRIGRFVGGDDEVGATAAAVGRALDAPGLTGVILDLRGCGGGNLQSAIDLVGGWLPPATQVVSQRSAQPARQRVWTTNHLLRLPRVPVVLLCDEGTASAAEVAALALRRSLRAPIIGTSTTGKWSVQQMFLLPRGDAMVLTVAHLGLPGGAPLDAPLAPDIAITQDRARTLACWRAGGDRQADLNGDTQLRAARDALLALTAAGAQH